MSNVIDWSKITTNEEVIRLIKEKEEIEAQIRKLEPRALIEYEYQQLFIPNYPDGTQK
jgi:hypothetical protein